ncbi:hypothetical protein NC651_002941 [Populus alba x Populus x berolinensis]|nr:hypothetical protein NC651_002941 [Populus alba x Populus x berolinensis]
MDGCLKELVAERDKKGISDSESMTARSRGLRLQSSDDKSEGIVPATAPNRCRVAVPCNFFFFFWL